MINPQEIASQVFSSRFRGFDPEEVKSYLSQVAEIMLQHLLEKEDLKKENEGLRETMDRYKKREELLRDTLVAAQKFSTEIKNNAGREADMMIKEAELRAEELLRLEKERLDRLREEIKTLQFKRREMENDVMNMLNNLKELIRTYQQEDEEYNKISYLGS